jgi:cytoskeletal protein RodZ
MIAADPSTADFGARLREARERRGISLRAIADASRISVRALEALERNDISRLPGGIYSRAFVRAYALEVGLDPEQTIGAFLTRFPHDTVTQGHPDTRAALDAFDARDGGTRTAFLWTLAVAALLVAAALAYLAITGIPSRADASASPSALVR